ncbi:beta-N-acetylhexosaminidase [Cesiribacter andamanensis]|uniref:Beta-hexosaminidase n=1 Tax=Cesiribacter andamanensis AMV16 TaxID=1279009 RepID=M7NUH4_9BACT|nr:family 20 glycosylhydrolase [Cesiribacter andamanensis]EMR02134.1 Beta-hexosaminidase [Cesiribacter andamanensis AMV16]
MSRSLRLCLLGCLLLLLPVAAQAQPAVHPTLALMPLPAQLSLEQGNYRLSREFGIALEGEASERLLRAGERFLRRLDAQTGLFLQQKWPVTDAQTAAPMRIRSARKGELRLHEDESYSLQIRPDGILLDAPTELGVLRGLQTLLQLVQADEEGYYFPALRIQDSPRFPWRGLMIDVARHFQPMDVLKRNLDGMEAVKLNVLHLHLSDDQGFRMESKLFPQLHERASEGEYFTQEQMREIIAYAGERGIRVVPEFDVPGHATSWLVAFPELGSGPAPAELERNSGVFDPTLDPTNEKTYEVLNAFFAEMAALFPDAYFHIGGDENEGRHWAANPQIQAFMKKNGLADKHALQTYFNTRIMAGLEQQGKKVMGWDEILVEGLPKSAVIHSWRGREGLETAARQGYTTLLSNGYYIDLLHPARDHYLVDPLPEGHGLSPEEAARVLGGETTMWSELVTHLTIDSRIWPRAAAIAERFWSPREVRDVADMYRRLEPISLQLERLGLQHLRNQGVILRNLAGSRDIGPLQTLVGVVEPLKGYTRNTNGTLYKTYSPFTLFADAATADAPDARRFREVVDRYLATKDPAARAEILNWLEKWKANHAAMKPLIARSPVLKEIEGLSESLSTLAALALESMQEGPARKAYVRAFNHKHLQKQLEQARRQGGRTELQVVDALEKLIRVHISEGTKEWR